jgi:acetyl esterase/lipase
VSGRKDIMCTVFGEQLARYSALSNMPERWVLRKVKSLYFHIPRRFRRFRSRRKPHDNLPKDAFSMKTFLFFTRFAVLACLAMPIFAGEPQQMPLWPRDSSGKPNVPGAAATSEADDPKMVIHLASSETPTPLVVVVPGGGYGGLASGHEGTDIAKWLNDNGISAAICLYRHRNSGAGYGYPYPIMDAQRAIRTVRENAKAWNVDQDKVGVIGFSAGGHLVTSLCTTESLETGIKDPIEAQSSRPDFAIVCYPVIAFGQPYTHVGSQRNLLGKDATAEQLAELSTNRRVSAKTPPTFIWHTAEDTVVKAQNSLVYYQALLDNGVSAELHVFQKGRHGLGLAAGTEGTETWPDLCLRWLHLQNVLAK